MNNCVQFLIAQAIEIEMRVLDKQQLAIGKKAVRWKVVNACILSITGENIPQTIIISIVTMKWYRIHQRYLTSRWRSNQAYMTFFILPRMYYMWHMMLFFYLSKRVPAHIVCSILQFHSIAIDNYCWALLNAMLSTVWWLRRCYFVCLPLRWEMWSVYIACAMKK